MHDKRGLTFADYLIILAIILLLAALAVPFFRKPDEVSPEEIVGRPAVTNANAAATNSVPAAR